MANIKISELPQLIFSSITNNDVIPIVDVNLNTTSKVLIGDLKTYFETTFTGGTISGLTEFTNGLISNTISATTYNNLPIDVFVTGGTYNDGVITFTNNSGNTFVVSGLTTPFTGGTIDTLSATTISGGTLYGDGSNLINLPLFTGGTIGDLTATTISATTYENIPEPIPYYANSLWTSFQNTYRATNSTNFGSNSSIGVGFNVPVNTRIKSAKLEISLFSVVCDGYLSIHKVENGIITERLWQEQYNIVGTGIYTFTGITLDLAPGNYAYATNQTIIQGYRSINLGNDNIFGLVPTLGATPYITGKSAGIVNLIPNPYPISQTDYFSSVPLVIFETELI